MQKGRVDEVLESAAEAPGHYALGINNEVVEVKDIINSFLEKYLDHIDSRMSEELPHDILYEWANSIKYLLRAPFKGSMISDLNKLQYCVSLIQKRMDRYYNED